jgi:hypothetical protein
MAEVTCPQCGRSLPYVEELAGRVVFCLGCGAHFPIPRLDIPPPSGPTEALKPLFLDIPPPDSNAGEPGG